MDNFEKLKFMADNEMDINIAPVSNIIGGQLTKRGGEFTIGVSAALFRRWMNGEQFCGGLILANRAQFDAIDAAKEGE